MSTLDSTVPYIPVLMVLPRRAFDKEAPLPEGYSWMKYDPALKEQWIALMKETGVISDGEAASQAWDEMSQDLFFSQRFVFVCAPDGRLCASAGLWPGTHFSAGRLRLHDVAVSLDHQRKGIAKAMIIHLARLYDQMPNKYPLYLATQSQSHDAIVLYSRLGFMPYMGQWSRRTKEESEEDWRQVTDILRQKHPSSQS